jgi:hypothetical protein
VRPISEEEKADQRPRPTAPAPPSGEAGVILEIVSAGNRLAALLEVFVEHAGLSVERKVQLKSAIPEIIRTSTALLDTCDSLEMLLTRAIRAIRAVREGGLISIYEQGGMATDQEIVELKSEMKAVDDESVRSGFVEKGP